MIDRILEITIHVLAVCLFLSLIVIVILSLSWIVNNISVVFVIISLLFIIAGAILKHSEDTINVGYGTLVEFVGTFLLGFLSALTLIHFKIFIV